MKISAIIFLILTWFSAVNSQTKSEAEREQETRAVLQKMRDVYLTEGVSNLGQNKYKEAIASLDKLLVADTENGEAYYYRGRAFAAKNNYERAMRDYAVVVKSSYKNPQIYFLIAKLEGVVGRNQEAIKAFNEFLKLQPDEANNKAFAGRAAERRCCRAIIRFASKISRLPSNSMPMTARRI